MNLMRDEFGRWADAVRKRLTPDGEYCDCRCAVSGHRFVPMPLGLGWSFECQYHGRACCQVDPPSALGWSRADVRALDEACARWLDQLKSERHPSEAHEPRPMAGVEQTLDRIWDTLRRLEDRL